MSIDVLKQNPVNDRSYVMMPGTSSVWVTVDLASIQIKRSGEGLSIDVYCKCGELVTETWATWGEFMHEEED